MVLSTIIANELLYQSMLRNEDAFSIDGYPVISEKEFENKIKKGERLHILDNLVLDLSNFAKVHPGGTFLIDYTVGRDISKFFYGGYSLDGNTSVPGSNAIVNNHSNVARKIAKSHVVAILGGKVQENAFIIQEKHSVNQTTSTLELTVHDQSKLSLISGIQSYYNDFSTFGKHFTVCSLG